jgi:hypothetical protein
MQGLNDIQCAKVAINIKDALNPHPSRSMNESAKRATLGASGWLIFVPSPPNDYASGIGMNVPGDGSPGRHPCARDLLDSPPHVLSELERPVNDDHAITGLSKHSVVSAARDVNPPSAIPWVTSLWA